MRFARIIAIIFVRFLAIFPVLLLVLFLVLFLVISLVAFFVISFIILRVIFASVVKLRPIKPLFGGNSAYSRQLNIRNFLGIKGVYTGNGGGGSSG